jgi:hypothetical protein
MSKYALRLLFSQRRWPAAYMNRDSGQGTVRDRSLQDLEGLDWGEANFDSHLVKFPRSLSPGYFAMRSTGDGGGRPFPAGCRENGKSREKIADMKTLPMSVPCPLPSTATREILNCPINLRGKRVQQAHDY